jgi:hypothetical protein
MSNRALLGEPVKSWAEFKELKVDGAVAGKYSELAGTDAGVTVPDGTLVCKLIVGTETGAYALAGPAGVAGQMLHVRNDSGQATTGLVVGASKGASFAHDGSNWLKIADEN